jgi:hypothetical protein
MLLVIAAQVRSKASLQRCPKARETRRLNSLPKTRLLGNAALAALRQELFLPARLSSLSSITKPPQTLFISFEAWSAPATA